MRKTILLFALLCASVMGFAYDIAPNTTFGGHFQWQEIDNVTPPANVVNVQSHEDFDCLYITFADAGFNRDYIVGGEVFTNDGAQAWLKLASFTNESTNVYFYQTGSTTEIKWGLRIINTSASGGSTPFDPSSINWSSVDPIAGQTQYKIYYTEENRPSNHPDINIQTAAWADNNTGIYVTTPDGISACSLIDRTGCWIQGAGVLLYLSAFVNEVTTVTITHASGTKTLYVYNSNAGGSSFDPTTIDWSIPSSTVVEVSGATQYKIGAENVDNMPLSVVGMQFPGWSEERGIYMTFPSADQLSCSVSATKDGSGMVIYESNFAYAILTEVTVTWNGGSKTFYVHNDSPITAPTTKAPTPATALSRVRPVSSQYTFNTHMSMLGWSSGMKQIDITREGSKFSCYKFGDYVLIGYGVTNVSQMNKIHLDVWTENAHTINFYLHSSGQEKAYEISLSAGSWTSVDIPLSHFDNVDMSAVDEFKFANASLADQAIFVDNIYFYADTDLPDPDPSSTPDTDFALRSNGAIAYGTAIWNENYPAKTIDGNNGTLWETIYYHDPQSLVIDFGQRRIFNMVKIYWGNQWASEFYLETSNNGTDWAEIKHVTDNTTNHANSEQSFELESNATARYIRFHGVARANGYGYTIKEFNAILAGIPVLSSVDVSSDKKITKVGEYATLTVAPKDQNGSTIAATLSYSISPADAGHVTDGKFYPEKYADATITITAEAGGVQVSNSVQVWGVVSDNLALNNALDGVGTWYNTDTPTKAVDGDDGSVWQGSTANGNINNSKIYDAWCVIDLKGNYNLQLIRIHFEGACSDAYKLYGSTNNEDWTELYSYAYPSPGDGDRIDNHTDWISTANLNNADNVHYLKFKSTRSATQYGMKIYEMEIYGAEVSTTKTVSATVSPAASGSVVITAGEPAEVVSSVESGTSVTFTATPAEGYDFINWTQGGVEVATTLAHTMTITSNTALVANFEAARTAYCAEPVTDTEGRTLYLTISSPSANNYKILFEGSANNKIGSDDVYLNTQFRLRNVNGVSVYHFAYKGDREASDWHVTAADENSYGSAYILFTADDFREISVYQQGVDLIRAAGGLSSFNAFPDVSTIKWDATCTDEEAPVLATPTATPLSGSSVRLALSATDDMAALLTYNINYKPEGDAGAGTDVAVNGTAGETTYTNIKGLSAGVRYQFSVTVSDGTNASAAQVCYAKPTMPTAPVPTHNATLVRSIYSDKYESVLAHDFQKDSWKGHAEMSFVEANINGDHSIVYDLAPYDADAWFSWGGFEGGENAIVAKDGYNNGVNAGLDASSMDYLHIDVMSTNSAPYAEVQIMDIKVGGIALTGSGWQSFDLPLAAYKAAHATEIANISHMKFVGFRGPNNPEEIAIDNVYFWNNGVQTTPVSGGEAATGGWATFAAATNVSVPSGITAYKASYEKTASEEVLQLTSIGSVIPANEGVLLRGEANRVYTFAVTTDAAPEINDNVLVGCPERTDISSVAATNDIFCLRYSELFGLTGFFLYTGQYIPAGKAYLPLPKNTGGSGAAPDRKIRFVFDQATSVENTNVDSVETTKFIENGQLFIRRGDAIYTIQGVRVK